jgi:hypothetical protein
LLPVLTVFPLLTVLAVLELVVAALQPAATTTNAATASGRTETPMRIMVPSLRVDGDSSIRPITKRENAATPTSQSCDIRLQSVAGAPGFVVLTRELGRSRGEVA